MTRRQQFVGESACIRRVRALIRKLACVGDSTVLLTGPSGMGKDLTARALHAASPRASRPFVNVTLAGRILLALASEHRGACGWA